MVFIFIRSPIYRRADILHLSKYLVCQFAWSYLVAWSYYYSLFHRVFFHCCRVYRLKIMNFPICNSISIHYNYISLLILYKCQVVSHGQTTTEMSQKSQEGHIYMACFTYNSMGGNLYLHRCVQVIGLRFDHPVYIYDSICMLPMSTRKGKIQADPVYLCWVTYSYRCVGKNFKSVAILPFLWKLCANSEICLSSLK